MADVRSYFDENDLRESLVLSLIYQPDNSEVSLVIDFARIPELIRYLNTGEKPQTTYRDFRKIVFVGVTSFKASGSWYTERDGQSGYLSKSGPPLVLQDYNLRKMEKLCINLYFAWNSECKFMFDSLKIEQRKGRAVKIGNDYVYYDVESGEEFDFYEPFA